MERAQPSRAPPRFARATTARPKRARAYDDKLMEVLQSTPLPQRILDFSREGIAYPVPRSSYDSTKKGAFSELVAPTCSSSQLGGVYWVLESELSRVEPKWKGSLWFESMTLRPEQSGKPFGGPGPGWDVYYRKPSAKHGCDWIGLPRFFGMSHLGLPAKDNRVEGLPMSHEAQESFTWGQNKETGVLFGPRPPQKVALEQTLRCLSRWGGTTIEMACGEGKSSLSTCLASTLGRKTLVVVPTRNLIGQWKGALGKHCPGATVGELREKYKPKKHDRAVECDFVVTTSRSMAVVEYPKELLRKFGTVIVDESHEIASRTLSQVLPRLACKYVIGLTATPQRRDGLGYALSWLMGPCVFRYQRIPRLTLKSNTIRVNRVMFDGGPRRVVTARWSDQIMWTDSLKLLSECPERNTALVEQVAKRMIFDGELKNPPVARDRVALLTLFCDHARELGRVAVEEFGFPESAVNVVVGDMPEAEQERKLADPNMRVLIGTIQLLGKGFDDPRLDCLVLCLPVGSKGDRLQQAVGRTERVLAGKAKPVVIDLVDTFDPFLAMSYSRSAFYRRFGWGVCNEAASDVSPAVLRAKRTRREEGEEGAASPGAGGVRGDA